jgi:hypothetical protein
MLPERWRKIEELYQAANNSLMTVSNSSTYQIYSLDWDAH